MQVHNVHHHSIIIVIMVVGHHHRHHGHHHGHHGHHPQTDPGDNVTPMELEFKNLANVKAEPSRFVSANLQVV